MNKSNETEAEGRGYSTHRFEDAAEGLALI